MKALEEKDDKDDGIRKLSGIQNEGNEKGMCKLTAIITLSWNINGDRKTQKISYTNAQHKSTVAT